MQDHPRATTAAAIGIGVLVVLFLYYLSVQPPSTRSGSNPVIAHGNQGPVIAGGDAGEPGGGQDIREIDFTARLGDDLSGGQALESVRYIDIDANGTEEAVVSLRGKGESRPLSWRLYGVRNGEPELLYERANVAQGEVQLDGPRIVESEGIFGESDQPCCPSSLKKAYYVWKGDGLVVSKVEAAAPAP